MIRSNGDLVEGLLNSPVWKEVAAPLLHEMIATVSGRLTNGRYYHGSLTHDSGKVNLAFVAGYQKSLMDFHNSLRDFIEERDKLARSVRERETEKRLPVYNPFLEELHEEGD